jgi:exonuclease III
MMNVCSYLFCTGMVLNLVSLNARGLTNKGKFEMVNEICKEQDIIVLQETNWKEEVMDEMKQKWKGQMFYNNGDGRLGRGVAILIRENVEINANEVYNDKKGKCNGIKVKQDDKEFVLLNVHAPWQEKEKKIFFEQLRVVTEKWENVIFVGDFNTVFSKIDMADGMVFKTDVGRKVLKEIMEERGLIDVWREKNEGKREFSRRQLVGNFMCQTRIDFILSLRDMECYLEDIYYKETGLSDHKMIVWKIDFNKEKRGPGVWILNSEILGDENYRKGIEELLGREKEDGMYLEDKRIWWLLRSF